MSCSTSASPEITPVTTASILSENRLVVIILRGGMDGLSAVQPIGDPHLAQWRGNTTIGDPEGPTDLDGFFALHPSLSPLMGLWEKEQLAFAHAVSTPYRDRRSHFDGQDLLEAGTANFDNGRVRDGWLNRMMQSMPGANVETAFAVGSGALSILAGDAEISRWAPSADLVLSPKTLKLTQGLMTTHPLFNKAMSGIMDLTSGNTPLSAADGGEDLQETIREALQKQVETLTAPLEELCRAVLTLESELGDFWNRTTIVAMTEFGRTVRLNGTKGTDHGTAGAMLFAGGALKGGRVLTDWPGLEEADLYDRRDLRPTRDVRDYSAWLLRSLFGFEKSFLETVVFPGLIMAENPRLLL